VVFETATDISSTYFTVTNSGAIEFATTAGVLAILGRWSGARLVGEAVGNHEPDQKRTDHQSDGQPFFMAGV
jgi:hypothetical protein